MRRCCAGASCINGAVLLLEARPTCPSRCPPRQAGAGGGGGGARGAAAGRGPRRLPRRGAGAARARHARGVEGERGACVGTRRRLSLRSCLPQVSWPPSRRLARLSIAARWCCPPPCLARCRWRRRRTASRRSRLRCGSGRAWQQVRPACLTAAPTRACLRPATQPTAPRLPTPALLRLPRFTTADEGDAAARWLSTYLGLPVRLARYAGAAGAAAPPGADPRRREVDPEWAPAGSGAEVAFCDGFPFLLANEVGWVCGW